MAKSPKYLPHLWLIVTVILISDYPVRVQSTVFDNILTDAKEVYLNATEPIRQLGSRTREFLFGRSVAVGINTYDKLCALRLQYSTVHNWHKMDTDRISFQLRSRCGNNTFSKMSELKDLKNFNPQKKIVFFVTGWTTNILSETNNLMAEAFVCRADINFILIDVDNYIKTFYAWSALNTRLLGDFIGESLVDLTKFVNRRNIRLVGHSLGAHIMGEAGRRFHNLTGNLIPHITALDPAFPCFNSTEDMRGLDKDSAEFVDVIHTSPGVLGQREPIGSADYYPGGLHYNQPGCLSFICSHSRAWMYFIETIYPGYEGIFVGRKCESFEKLGEGHCDMNETSLMGFNVSTNKTGIFTVNVVSKPPFVQGLGLTEIPKLCNKILCL